MSKVVYSIRSKRGGGHKSPIPPQEIDAYLCLNATKYVLAELLRIYSDAPQKTVANYIRSFIRPKLPYIEEFENGEIMILVEVNSCFKKILLSLYHYYPNRLSNEQLRGIIKNESTNNVLTSLGNTEKKKMVHRNNLGSKLTEKGVRHIENKYSI